MECNPTNHIDECPHAFVKNNVVEHILVFKEEDHNNTELFTSVHADHGTDTVVCLCSLNVDVVPHLWSTWDGTKFTEPTLDYLYSIGISNVNQAMADARNAAFAAEIAAEEATKAAEATPAPAEPAAPTA